MLRRRRPSVLVLAAVAIATVTSGCGTFENSDSAATVGGVDISQGALDRALEAVVVGPDDTSGVTTAEPAPMNAEADLGRALLSVLIQATASRAFLAEAGEAVDPQQLEAFDPASAAIPGVPQEVSAVIVNSLSGDDRALLAEFILAQPAWGRTDLTGAEEAYAASPYEAGAVCLRLLVVDSPDVLAEAQAELDAGTAFEDVVRQYSVDEGTRESGGVLADASGSECLPASNFTPETVGEAAQTVIDLGAGEYSEPIEQPGTAGAPTYLVLYSRPFAEVAEAAAGFYGPVAFADYLATADVSVDPRYGRWDTETSAVVALAP